MADWTCGYVSEVDYVHGYVPALSPLRLRLAMAFAGQKFAAGAEPAYLELGFGQGHSLNIHAATNAGSFWGTDFNAAQAASAGELAAAAGAATTILDASFAELAGRADLPEFDVIVLHGIWSWISDENRAVVIDIARRKLKPGGLFYVSYNTAPGWSPAVPLRHIMKEHATRASSGSLPNKLAAAITFAQSLADAGAGYFMTNPAVVQRLRKLKDQNPHYLAHEYLNDSWDVMAFSQVADRLAAAKLTFATSGHLKDLVDAINLSPEGQILLAGIDDAILRQTARDYFVNQQFRRDIFVKGARPLTPYEHAVAIRTQRFVLLVQPEDRPTSVKGALGDARLADDIYQPITEALAADGHRPKSIDEMMREGDCKGIGLPRFIQAMTILCGAGAAAPAQNEKAMGAVRKTAQALNEELCRRAEHSSDVEYLAAPLIGAGIAVNRVEQLFLRAMRSNQKDVPDRVWSLLKGQGHKIVIDGKALDSDEDNLNDLRARCARFQDKRLPIFKRLGIV